MADFALLESSKLILRKIMKFTHTVCYELAKGVSRASTQNRGINSYEPKCRCSSCFAC